MKKLIICLLFVVFLVSCAKTSAEPISGTRFLLGTVCTIRIYDKKNKDVLESAFDEIKRIENLVSTTITESEIYHINKDSGVAGVAVSREVFDLVKRALEHTVLSEGVFNIAIGPLVDLWGIGTSAARLPSEEEIEEVLPLLDYMNVELDETSSSIFLKEKGMALDLGAIAKGYIADKIVELLQQNGVRSAIINLGGNVFAMGVKTSGDNWKIGIQDPFTQRNDYFSVYQAKHETIVSSGVYERFFEKDNIRYHHILDYKTGYPVKTDIQSVTIIGPESEMSDVLSTILFSLGIESGTAYLSHFPGYGALFVDNEKKITLFGIDEELFELSNSDYTVIRNE